MAERCRQLESLIEDRGTVLSSDELLGLEARWASVCQSVDGLIGDTKMRAPDTEQRKEAV